MGESELAALGYLLKASSKDTVEKCLSIAFVSRNDVTSVRMFPFQSLMMKSQVF
jgi:hypothetical protein